MLSFSSSSATKLDASVALNIFSFVLFLWMYAHIVPLSSAGPNVNFFQRSVVISPWFCAGCTVSLGGGSHRCGKNEENLPEAHAKLTPSGLEPASLVMWKNVRDVFWAVRQCGGVLFGWQYRLQFGRRWGSIEHRHCYLIKTVPSPYGPNK